MKIGRFFALSGPNIVAVIFLLYCSVQMAQADRWTAFGLLQFLLILNAGVLGLRIKQLIYREGYFT